MKLKAEMPKPPCAKDCPGRGPACAVECEKWKAYVEERNRGYEQRRILLETSRPTVSACKTFSRTAYLRKKDPGRHK